MTEAQKVRANKNLALKILYRKLPDVKRYLVSLGCNASDAEDIFQEALLIFSRKVDEPDFDLTVAPFHYVKNTCKFLWYNTSRKKNNMRTQEISDHLEVEDTSWWEKETKLRRIEMAIEKIGQKCQRLLKMFYGKEATMTEIAQRLGLRNDKVAKAQKYRCIHKVREVIESENHNEDDLYYSPSKS